MDFVKGQYNEVYLRKRKMLLVLPALLIPMITLAFYGLGGGKGSKAGHGLGLGKGLNMSLPDARFDPKRKNMNKLGFYSQSDKDSLRMRESRKMDPYYRREDSAGRMGAGLARIRDTSLLAGRERASGLALEPSPADGQAAELLKTLDKLKGVLNKQEGQAVPSDASGLASAKVQTTRGMELPGLPRVTPPMPVGARMQPDPDLDKLNTLMDKVLRIRYPGDAPLRDTVMPGPVERAVGVLAAAPMEDRVSMLAAEQDEDAGTGFIGLDDERPADSLAEHLIAAEVAGGQTLVSGESVDLRMEQEAVVGGVRIPKGTTVSGKATLSGERLLVTVTSIRVPGQLVPVSLEVVDMDGVTGIRVKGSINRDMSKQSASDAVSSVGVTSFDPGLGGQAAAAGLQAARSLLGRKVRLVRVGLPAGYRVLLKNTKGNH